MAEKLGTALLELGTDDRALKAGIARARKAAQKLNASFKRLGRQASTFITAPITALATATALLADKQLNAERTLATVLKLSGANADSRLKGMKEFASSLQEITIVGDETTLQNIQVAKSMGLTDKAAKRAAKNAIGLSAAFGINAQSAIRYTAALEEGDTTMLNRYIPTLKNIKNETDRVAAAQDILAGAFKAATEQAKTGLGPFRQMLNDMGDLGEEFGTIIIPAITEFSAGIRGIIKSIRELSPVQKEWIIKLATAVAVGGPILIGLALIAAAFAALLTVTGAVVTLLAGAGGLAAWFALSGTGASNFTTMIQANETSLLNAASATKEYRLELAALIKTQMINAGAAAEVIGDQLDIYQDAIDQFGNIVGPKLPFQHENIKIVGEEMDKVLVKYKKAVALSQGFRRQLLLLEDIEIDVGPITPGGAGIGSGGAGGGPLAVIADDATSTLERFAESAGTIASNIGDAFATSFQGASNAIRDFVQTGKLDVKSMVRSMIADLAALTVKRAILGPLAGALSGALGGVFGVGADAVVAHAGGVIGSSLPSRTVPAMTFAGAPRMHSGGVAGLSSNEVPAILEKGERVIPKGGGGGDTFNFNITTPDVAGFQRSQAQIAAVASRAISAARRIS